MHATEINNKRDDNKHKKPRCYLCQKKVGLFGLKCKCENIYCNLHFHAENHNCPYDYKQDYTSNSLGGGQYKKIDKI